MTPSPPKLRRFDMVAPTYAAVLDVARNLRPEDRAEVEATRGPCPPESLATDFYALAGIAVLAAVIRADRRPVGILSIMDMGHGRATVGLLATPEIDRVILALTRHVRKIIVPAAIDFGIRRAEARAVSGASSLARWLEILGAELEGQLDGYGLRESLSSNSHGSKIMCLASTPKIRQPQKDVTPIKIALPSDQRVSQAGDTARRRAQLARGFGSTILAGQAALSTGSVPVGTKVLLGS